MDSAFTRTRSIDALQAEVRLVPKQRPTRWRSAPINQTGKSRKCVRSCLGSPGCTLTGAFPHATPSVRLFRQSLLCAPEISNSPRGPIL